MDGHTRGSVRSRIAAVRASNSGRWALACSVVLALVASPFAIAAGEGNPLIGGKRNPRGGGTLASETQIIAGNATYGTRQSSKGEGGGAIYGCRTVPGNEPCVRANNLNTGRAFEFQATKGAEVGLFQVGDSSRPSATGVPFRTNAQGRVDNLNADRVDGLDESELRALTAVVSAAGTRDRGNGSTGSSRSSEGNYEVLFERDVSGCTYTASLGDTAGGTPPAGEVGVARGASSTAVHVTTRDSGGTEADRPFHVSVNC